MNGKLRGKVQGHPDAAQKEIQDLALQDEKISKFIKGEIVKVIFVPKKLINFVVKA